MNVIAGLPGKLQWDLGLMEGDELMRFLVLAFLMTVEARAAQDPMELPQRAHEALAQRDYSKAAGLTKKANAIWNQEGANSPEYAESLVLCSLAMLAEKRWDGGAQRSKEEWFTVWEKDAGDLLERALAISAIKPDVQALALELESLQPKNKDKSTMLRIQAMDIHTKLVEGILPGRVVSDSLPPKNIGEVQPPTLIHRVEPSYSAEAIILLITGGVQLNVIVEPDGTASTAKVLKPLGWGLDEEAAKCLKGWRFNSGTIGGTPVRVQVTIEISFRLI